MERRNPNYVGGDINGGVQDLRQLFTRPVARPVPYATPVDGRLHLLVVDAAGRRRARHVRLLGGPRRAAFRVAGPDMSLRATLGSCRSTDSRSDYALLLFRASSTTPSEGA